MSDVRVKMYDINVNVCSLEQADKLISMLRVLDSSERGPIFKLKSTNGYSWRLRAVIIPMPDELSIESQDLDMVIQPVRDTGPKCSNCEGEGDDYE